MEPEPCLLLEGQSPAELSMTDLRRGGRRRHRPRKFDEAFPEEVSPNTQPARRARRPAVPGIARRRRAAADLRARTCEDCALKQPSFGLPAEGRRRWCGGCAKAHAGTRDIASRRCEDCALKKPSFGLPAEGRTRWCAGCAKAHAGAQSLSKRRRSPGALAAAQANPPKRRAPVAGTSRVRRDRGSAKPSSTRPATFTALTALRQRKRTQL